MVVLMAALLTSGLLMSCIRGDVTGSGNLDTQEMDFSGFTRVDAGYGFEVEILQSDTYSITITADDNLFEYIQVSKEGETLKIGLKPGYSYVSTTLKAEIAMPDLYELELSGGSHGTVQGFSSSHDLTLDLSGGSRVTGDITAGYADFDLSGGSSVQLQGSANDIVINASSGSHMELANFPVDNADVNLSGGSRGTVNLDGILNADLSGGSHLIYLGTPNMGDIDISGSSTISPE